MKLPMRPFCRHNNSSLQYAIPVLLLFALAPIAISSQVQSPVQTGEASDSSGVPAEWQNPLRELSARIAKLLSPGSKIALAVNNISPLAPEDIAFIENMLKIQLASDGVHFGSGSDAPMQVTVSEGVDGYIVTAQIKTNANEQVAIVTLPRIARSAPQSDGVLLDAKLIWQQPTQFLDFALPAAPGFSQNLLAVLEPQRLVFYSRDIALQWQLVRAIQSESSIASRDPRGHIEFSLSSSAGDARWPGTECKGDFLRPASVACTASDHRDDGWISGDSRAPFVPVSGGDAVSVGLQCRSNPIALATGGGDWTQPDFIQAYETRSANVEGTVPSGSPINFSGPVMAIWASGAPGVARAVIRNLQTGNYEAYLVTATCTQ